MELKNLRAKVKKADINLNEKFYKFCQNYIYYLMQYNKTHNITGAKTTQGVEENIYDSLYPICFLPQVKRVLDIGTGAGFPGMILAFALPNTKFYLVEPIKKRASFLTLIKSSLSLDNVEIINKRVEEVEGLKIDLITSRAVTNIDLLFKISKNLITKETKFLFFKGSNVQNEITKEFDYDIINRDMRNYIFIRQL